jgi:hypothetical protein
MLTLFLTFLASLSLAQAAESPNAPARGAYRVDGDVNYFTTTSNYAPGGASKPLADGAYLHLMQFQGRGSYDWSAKMRFYAGADGAWVQTSDGGFSRTNSGLSDIYAGGQYWARFGSIRLVPEASLLYPIFKVDESSDSAMLGEGTTNIQVGGWAIWNFGPWSPFVYAGYAYRDSNRANLIPYTLGVKYANSQWWAQGEFRGFETLQEDGDTSTRDHRNLTIAHVDGGSFRFYSVNPAVGEAVGQVGYNFGMIGIRGGIAMTMHGSSYANGTTFFGGLSFTPGPRQTSAPRTFSEPVMIRKSTEDLFDESDPTRPPPPPRARPRPAQQRQAAPPPAAPTERAAPQTSPQPRTQPARQPQPQVKLIKKKRKPVVRPNPKTNQMLNETEKQLEQTN